MEWKRLSAMLVAVALSGVGAFVRPAQADSRFFDANSSTTWIDDGTTLNWATTSGGPYDASVWIGGSDAHFEGTAGTVTVSGTIGSVNSISFDVSGYALTGGTIRLTGNAAIGGDNDAAISSVLIGAAGLTKTGGGTLTLTGVSTYSGLTTISGGRLLVQGSGRIPGGNVSVASGTTLEIAATNWAFGGNISGQGGLTKSGTSGDLRLTGTNTYTGPTVVSGSGKILRAGSIQAFGNNSAMTVNSGAIVELNGYSHALGAIAGSGTIRNRTGDYGSGSASPTVLTVGGNNNSTEFSGVMEDGSADIPLALRKVGTGTLTLRGESTYTGNTYIEQGRIILGTGNDRLPTGTTVTLGSGTSSGVLSLGAPDYWRNQTLAGLLTSGTGTGNRVTGGGTSAEYSTLTLNIADTNVFGGILGGPDTDENRLNLVKAGNGTLTLAGANTYQGTTVVTGEGILRAGSNQAFGNGSALTIDISAAVELNGWSLAVGSLAGSGTVRNQVASGSGPNNPTVLTVGGNNASTEFSGVIADGDGGVPLALRKVGTGELILRGVSTYSGGTAVEEGRLVLGTGADRLPVGTTVTLGGGTGSGVLALGGPSSSRDQTLAGLLTSGSGESNRVLGGGTSVSSSSTLTLNIAGTNEFDGLLGGPGENENHLKLTKMGAGTLRLLGANTHKGDTLVSAGTLALDHVDALQNSTLDTGSSGSQQVTFAVAGTNTYNLGGLKGADALALGANSISVGSNGQTTTLSGVLSGTGTLTKVGNGTLTLTGVNSGFTGMTNIDAGILRLQGASGYAFASFIDLAPEAELHLGSTGGVNISGSITGSGHIRVLSGGFYRFSGNNSFTSDITLDGRLRVGSATALGNVNNVVTMNTGSILELYGWNAAIGSLAGTGTVRNEFASGGGSDETSWLTTGGNGNSTVFSGTIQDGGGGRALALKKSGTGTFTLTGTGTYTGATIVDAGTLKVDGSLSGTSGVTLSAGATLAGSGTVAATVGGSGLLSPGSSPGILTIAQFDPFDPSGPSGGLDTALEFTVPGSPDYGEAFASGNDVLRITEMEPFKQPLDAGNAIDVYFDLADLVAGTTFQGGFYTDSDDDFLPAIENASFAYWVTGNGLGTDHSFNGQGYYSLEKYASWFSVDVSTMAAAADFGAGLVSGRVAQFAVVPEPGTVLLLASGVLGLLVLRRRDGIGR